jgi:hypothetical protein
VSCDDGDQCTVDACDPVVGCTHSEEPATTPTGVLCSTANLRSLMGGAPLCTGSCPRTLDHRLEIVERRVTVSARLPAGRQRRRALAAALDAARALDARVVRLARRGRLSPPDRAARFVAEANRLRDRLQSFVAISSGH